VDGINSIAFEVKFVNVWVGSVSTAWETAENWSCGVLPDENTDVEINSGTVLLSSNVAIRSIRVNPNSSFSVVENFTLSTK
jgi:hypothetical protein